MMWTSYNAIVTKIDSAAKPQRNQRNKATKTN
jgi:hypothetical protein